MLDKLGQYPLLLSKLLSLCLALQAFECMMLRLDFNTLALAQAREATDHFSHAEILGEYIQLLRVHQPANTLIDTYVRQGVMIFVTEELAVKYKLLRRQHRQMFGQRQISLFVVVIAAKSGGGGLVTYRHVQGLAC